VALTQKISDEAAATNGDHKFHRFYYISSRYNASRWCDAVSSSTTFWPWRARPKREGWSQCGHPSRFGECVRSRERLAVLHD
jgi:hypothetical protein